MASPPPPDMTQKALECLRRVRAQLSATPRDIRPFDSGATLKWTITPPSDQGCDLTFSLNGNVITAQGAMEVQPPETTEYRIEGSILDTRMVLAKETVTVATDHCIQITVPEQNIRTLLQDAIAQLCASNAILSERRQAVVEVDRRGVSIRVYFKINIENAPDPDLDVDCVIGLRAEDASVAVSFRRFDLDLDWPKWITVASAGVSKIAERIVEEVIEKNMKPMLLGRVEGLIDSYLRMLPPGFRLYRIETSADMMTVIVCPSPRSS